MRVCKIEGCGKPHKGRGYCNTHYHRLYKSGTLELLKPANGTIKAWVLEHKNYTGKECLIWPFSRDAKGYARVNKHYNAFSNDGLAAAMMLTASGKDRPIINDIKYECCHTCNNGYLSCVNPMHLYWGTHQQNQLDRFRK